MKLFTKNITILGPIIYDESSPINCIISSEGNIRPS